MYYDKYMKYKNKYLQLKNQIGGETFCEKAYKNILGTCWAVAIQTMLTFSDVTSKNLKTVMQSFDFKTKNDFIKNRIEQVKSNPQLNDFFPNNIFNHLNDIYLKNVLDKFIDRYYSKVLEIKNPKTPIETMYIVSNKGRCEFQIDQNFKKIFNIPFYKYIKKSIHGGNYYDDFLLSNLLSIFFLNHKVSFKRYFFDEYNLINFDNQNDIGIIVFIKGHACCLYMCDGQPKYYNDNDYEVYNFDWINLLKKTSHTDKLYVKKGFGLLVLNDELLKHEIIEDISIVDYLIVVSKHNKDTDFDIDLINELNLNLDKINNIDILVKVGKGYEEEGNYEKATKSYELAWKKEVNYEILYNLIRLNKSFKKYDKVIYYYKIGVNLGNKQFMWELGKFYNFLGKDKEALKYLKMADSKKSFAIKYDIAILNVKMKNFEEAFKNFKTIADEVGIQFHLIVGYMYENGIGTSKDLIKAQHYKDLALGLDYNFQLEDLEYFKSLAGI